MSRKQNFTPLTATAAELQARMTAGTLSSVDIVETYLAQIERHNFNGLQLRAVLSVAPRELAIARAAELDAERANGRTRGRLHGIPIIVKVQTNTIVLANRQDVFMTEPSMGMVTTAGSHVFAGSRPKKNAKIIDMLLDGGAIILGKANLTTPAGSSSGSGVSVAAGFAPLALGSETSGSNVYPASCSGLYSIRLSIGSVPLDGVFGISKSFDGVGVMAKSARDLPAIMEGVIAPIAHSIIPDDGYKSCMTNRWEGIRVAMLPTTWGFADGAKWDSPEVKASYEGVAKRINDLGGKAVYPVDLKGYEDMDFNGKNPIMFTSFHEFPSVVANFAAQYQDPRVNTLAELVAWNEAHADIALPGPCEDQNPLIKCVNDEATDEEAAAAAAHARKTAREIMTRYMDECGVDVVVSNSECILVSYAACSGWAIGTVPLGNLAKNDQPYGLFLLARDGREDVLLRFMSAFEATFPKIRGPSQLV